MNRKPLGSPVRTGLDRNCLLCARWASCRDPDKNLDYACSRFKTTLDTGFTEHYEQVREEGDLLVRKKPTLILPKGTYNTKEKITEEDDDDSISDLIDRVLQSGVPVPPDLRIDDRDIPRPANVLEWTTGEGFIAGGTGTEVEKPFAKQLEICLKYFGEFCPRCSDEEYFEDVPVDATPDDILEYVVPLEHGVCPNCNWNKSELFCEGLLPEYYGGVFLIGQRSGKTAMAATMIESYNIARWLTTPNIPLTYKLRSSSIITATYTAVTFGQAKDNFWEPLNATLSTAPWFREYHALLHSIGRKYGEELIKHGETLIAYRHRNLFCGPASPSQRTLRGKSRISAQIDEAGWFRVGSRADGKQYEQMNGLEVWKALDSSMTTIRGAHMDRLRQGYHNIPKPIMTLASSPQARNDLIMTKYREAENSQVVMRSKNITWDFNPNIKKYHLAERYRTDPIGAARDFECEPPLAMNAWMTDESLAQSLFSKRPNAVRTVSKRVRTKSGKLNMSGQYKTVREAWYESGAILGIDAGSVFNSFAYCIAIPTYVPDSENEEEESLAVHVDIVAVGEIQPRENINVSFTGVYREILQPLCEQYNVATVVSDRWQNRMIVQSIEDALGISYFEIKLGMPDFDALREAAYQQEISFPRLDMPVDDILNITLEEYPRCFEKTPVSHLYYQLLTVQNAGTAIIKGDGVTDDIFRAMAIAYAGLQDEEILEDVLSLTNDAPARPATASLARGSAGGRSMLTMNAAKPGVASLARGGGRGMLLQSGASMGSIARRR